MIIGENLKRIRLEQNLSLGQLSSLCDVSKVMLSQIEKGVSNPSINTVWKIADALQIPYTALLEQEVDGGIVISGKSIPVQKLDEGCGNLRCYYQHAQNRNFELFQMEVEPGGVHISQGHGERTDEYVMVVAGILKIMLDDGEHILQAGDAISFHSNKMHTYYNDAKTPLQVVIINYYR